MRITGWIVLAVIAGMLGGCAESPPPTHAEKRGAYKIGKPYQVGGVWYYPAEDYSYDETGIASWYGPNFHAKDTANGEIYDQNSVTAAHKTLPLPCFVRVTNLENGRSIIVRINDRGPYVASRIIDLSRRSAQLLGVEGKGTARVRVQIMAEESRALAARLKSGEKVDYAAAMPSQDAVAAPPPAHVTAPPPRQPVAEASLSPEPRPVVTKPAEPHPVVAAPAPEPQLESQPVRMVAVKPTQVYIQAGAFQKYDNANRVVGTLRPIRSAVIMPITVNGGEVFRVRMGPISTVEEADRLLDRVISAGYPEARVVVD